MLSQPRFIRHISTVYPIAVESERIKLLDQRKIPEAIEYFDATSLEDMCYAITEMVVRGAPAIGVAAALGLAFEAERLAGEVRGSEAFFAGLQAGKRRLQATRPTAVNLRWGTEAIYELARALAAEPLPALAGKLISRAQDMIDEDIQVNLAIGEHGAGLLMSRKSVLTHCNAGALATCGWGTALGVIRSAVGHGAALTVYVDETRPRQQGARLTAWELLQDNITPTLITDSMAGYLMSQEKVDIVIVGADRIASNGDTANKIGTYSLAVLAKAHKVPFYIAAPRSTIDLEIATGKDIPIEERSREEVTRLGDLQLCSSSVQVYNPAFDVTPARLISGIITEKGIASAPYKRTLKAMMLSDKHKN